MKAKFILSLLLSIVTVVLYAQSWQTGTNKLYSNPSSTTNVGIGTTNPEARLHIDNGALKLGNSTSAASRNICRLQFGDEDLVEIGEWEGDDKLTLKAPNGIHLITDELTSISSNLYVSQYLGVNNSSPEYSLDINGKMMLRTVNAIDGWGYSYFHWPYHSLVMGTPQGSNAHNSIDLKPGGFVGQTDTLFSRLRMFTAYGINNHSQKIEINTEYDTWFMNRGNFGIGTSTPQYDLDVNGTIHATEIIVSTPSTADFVFDENYKLPELQSVESYVKENKHLPDIPSANEMEQNGVTLNELTIQLLQKIEELTLYTIEQEKRIKQLEQQLNK